MRCTELKQSCFLPYPFWSNSLTFSFHFLLLVKSVQIQYPTKISQRIYQENDMIFIDAFLFGYSQFKPILSPGNVQLVITAWKKYFCFLISI